MFQEYFSTKDDIPFSCIRDQSDQCKSPIEFYGRLSISTPTFCSHVFFFLVMLFLRSLLSLARRRYNTCIKIQSFRRDGNLRGSYRHRIPHRKNTNYLGHGRMLQAGKQQPALLRCLDISSLEIKMLVTSAKTKSSYQKAKVHSGLCTDNFLSLDCYIHCTCLVPAPALCKEINLVWQVLATCVLVPQIVTDPNSFYLSYLTSQLLPFTKS